MASFATRRTPHRGIAQKNAIWRDKTVVCLVRLRPHTHQSHQHQRHTILKHKLQLTFQRSPVTLDLIISQNWKDTFQRWRRSVFLNEKENIGSGPCREAWRDLLLCLHLKAQTMCHFLWSKRREATEILEYTGQQHQDVVRFTLGWSVLFFPWVAGWSC